MLINMFHHHLGTVSFNQIEAQHLSSYAKIEGLPHMIIQGAEGSGRHTMALLYLKERYHLTDLVVKSQMVEIKSGSKVISLHMLYSDYHCQIDPSQHGVYDRIILQNFIKDMLRNKPITEIPYHIMIINNADRLTIEAQQSLRRTLEKKINTSRFIFLVNQESCSIDSLISRCLQVRLSSPTVPQIIGCLNHVCQSEQINVNPQIITQIANHSKRNLITAYNLLQSLITLHATQIATMTTVDLSELNSNDQYVAELIDLIVTAKTPQHMIQIRKQLYDLLVQCVNPVKIQKMILEGVLEHLSHTETPENRQKMFRLIDLSVKYENTLKYGSKEIYHLEGMCFGIVNMLNTYS